MNLQSFLSQLVFGKDVTCQLKTDLKNTEFLISKIVVFANAIADTLLPKLICGKLRVPDAEKLVEEVWI